MLERGVRSTERGAQSEERRARGAVRRVRGAGAVLAGLVPVDALKFAAVALYGFGDVLWASRPRATAALLTLPPLLVKPLKLPKEVAKVERLLLKRNERNNLHYTM